MSIQTGTLYVVATPIGNLEDLSTRASRILSEVDLIAAEDTRHSRKLLSYLGITTPLKSYHDYNERKSVPALLRYLKQGEDLALITDAGTPLISDPGYHLVQAAQVEGIRIVPVPGPSALIGTLSVAGLPTDKFIFEGFVSAKREERKKQLSALEAETRTMVFYEAPHRILDFLADAVVVFGEERLAVVARELTKKYETIYRDTLGNLFDYLRNNKMQRKGEFVVVIRGTAAERHADDLENERILKILLTHLSVKEAAVVAAEITGGRKNELYKLALNLSNKE